MFEYNYLESDNKEAIFITQQETMLYILKRRKGFWPKSTHGLL